MTTSDRPSSPLGAKVGTILESQAPWLRCLRTACGNSGSILADILVAESIVSMNSLPFGSQKAANHAKIFESLSLSLSLLARISVLTAELARNVSNIRNEMSLANVHKSRLALDELIVSNFRIGSATILQDLGIINPKGNDWVPARQLVHFIAAFKSFDEIPLIGDTTDPIYTLLATLSDGNYGFLYESFPLAVKAVFLHVMQIITVSHPAYLGDFYEAHINSDLFPVHLAAIGNKSLERDGVHFIISLLDRINGLVSFALSSYAGLVQVNETLKQEVNYPVHSAAPTVPEIVTSAFLPYSSNQLVQLVLDLPPRFGKSWESWSFDVPPCQRAGTSSAAV